MGSQAGSFTERGISGCKTLQDKDDIGSLLYAFRCCWCMRMKTFPSFCDQKEKPTGILLCGHGSRHLSAKREFTGLASALRERLSVPLRYGFLEFCSPTLETALDDLRAQGVERVLALPAMLFAAGHAKDDIPSVLRTYERRFARMEIFYARDLSITPALLRASCDRLREALRGEPLWDFSQTLLLLVGRGTSDPDANSNISKVARMLWEGLGFGWSEVAYSGVTFPVIAQALRRVVGLGFRQVVVFPYFLFDGVLVQRIYRATEQAARAYPEISFRTAPYLRDHPQVVQTFEERIQEISRGENVMNCKLCKYRDWIPGFGSDVGAAQQSHHHHVEGLLAKQDVSGGTVSGVHTHRPYLHASHPLGPRGTVEGIPPASGDERARKDE